MNRCGLWASGIQGWNHLPQISLILYAYNWLHKCLFVNFLWIHLLPVAKVSEQNCSYYVQLWGKRSLTMFMYIYVPSHEIMVLFVLRRRILQTGMRSHPVGLDIWFFVRPFVYFHTSCVRTAKALARLRSWGCSTEPSLVAYVIVP